MRLLCLIVVILLVSCGNHTKVEFHEVDQQTLNSIAGGDVNGFAKWKDYGFVVYCDIYLMPIMEYKTAQCYDAVVKHELRHCYEFKYHGNDIVIQDCP